MTTEPQAAQPDRGHLLRVLGVTFGVAVVSLPAFTFAVDFDVLDTDVNPDFAPVTVTLTVLPLSAAVSL